MADLCCRPRGGLAVLHSIQAIVNVASRGEEGRHAVVKTDVLRQVLRLCNESDSHDVLAVATQVLVHLARHKRGQEQLLRANCIPVLAKLASGVFHEEPVVGNAKFVIDNLGAVAIAAAGGEMGGSAGGDDV